MKQEPPAYIISLDELKRVTPKAYNHRTRMATLTEAVFGPQQNQVNRMDNGPPNGPQPPFQGGPTPSQQPQSSPAMQQHQSESMSAQHNGASGMPSGALLQQQQLHQTASTPQPTPIQPQAQPSKVSKQPSAADHASQSPPAAVVSSAAPMPSVPSTLVTSAETPDMKENSLKRQREQSTSPGGSAQDETPLKRLKLGWKDAPDEID